MAEHDKIDIPEGRFPSNSYSSIRTVAKGKPEKEQEEAPIKAVKGTVQQKKKTFGERIADAFISTTKTDIRDYFIFDVLVPGLKRGIEDFIHMVLYNDRKGGKVNRSRGESRIRRVGYNSIYASSREDEPALSSQYRSGYSDLTFDTQADAESYLSKMSDRIEDCGSLTLSYFNERAGFESEWPQNSWGWRTVAGAKIYKLSDGRWILKMPRLEEL